MMAASELPIITFALSDEWQVWPDKNHQTSLSFVDCYAAIEAKSYGNILITLDKQLVKHGGNHVKELK